MLVLKLATWNTWTKPAHTHTEVTFKNFEKRLKKEIDGLLSMESRL